jgi:YfiH family protein
MERILKIAALNHSSGVDHLFGTRWVESAQAVARYLGLPELQVVTVRQVHGDGIRVVDSLHRKEGSSHSGHDALITDQPGLVLTVATADCVPILIADGTRKVVAAVHAGWRGSLLGISAKVVMVLQDRFASRPRDLRVGMGPSAGVCCYEVGQEVLEPLKKKFPDFGKTVQERRNGKALLDLRAFNRLQLTAAGIPEDRIHVLPACTICGGSRFRSYRWEGRGTGSMYSGIVMRPS